MSGIKTIIQKELHRVFIDKRLIFSVFILPVILVICVCFLIDTLQKNITEKINTHEYIVCLQGAPSEIIDLGKEIHDKTNIQILYIKNNDDITRYKEKVKKKKIDIVVVFNPKFEKQYKLFLEGKKEKPTIDIYYNPVSNYSINAKEKFQTLILEQYNRNKVEKKFGNSNMIAPFSENLVSVIDKQKENQERMAMIIPYSISMILFATVMSLGVDAVAGEKERGTMVSLLLAPIKRRDIIIGKIIALSILAVISLLCAIGGVVLFMYCFMKNRFLGNDIGILMELSIRNILVLAIVMFNMILIFTIIIFLVASLSESVKEANTYISPIYIIVLFIGIISMYRDELNNSNFNFFIPILGNMFVIQNLIRSELTIKQFLYSFSSSIILFLIILYVINRIFENENIVSK